MAVQIQARVVGQYLQSGAHNEEHEEQVQIVLIAQPPRESARHRPAKIAETRILRDERFDFGKRPQVASTRDRTERNQHAHRNNDREDLSSREPVPADAHLRQSRHLLRNATRELAQVNPYAAFAELNRQSVSRV